MALFIKSAAGIIIALVLILAVGKREKDIALLLEIAVCCMTAVVAFDLFKPVLSILYQIEAIAQLEELGINILFKAVGIGLLSELVISLCQDTGNAALGKQMQLLASILILSCSIPLLEAFLDLVQNLLGDI